MRMQSSDRQQKIIGEQAAEWVCDLREAGPDRQTAFLAWLKQSPRHVREFLFAATVWREARAAALHDDVDLQKLMKEALAEEGHSNVVAMEEPHLSLTLSAPLAGGRWGASNMRWAAGVAALAITAALGWQLFSETSTYATATGEQRTVRLDDGSLLYMNTQSKVRVRFSGHARDLQLFEGEVLFTVQQDAARPFRVETDGTVIQALGTQFNVYRRADATKISVIEGSVKVISGSAKQQAQTSSLSAGANILAAGEQANITRAGRIAKQTLPNVAEAVAWRERRLVFQGEKLEDVAAEFNRYNPRHIRVEGDVARGRLLSGTFDADDPESLVLFLNKLNDLSVETRDGARNGEIVVRAR